MSEFEPTEQTETAVPEPITTKREETADSTPLVVMPDAPVQETATNRQRSLIFIAAGISIVIDQITKGIVESTLPLYQMYAPIPAIQEFFRITHVPNTGMAFGLFSGGSLFFTGVAILVGLAIIYYNFTLPRGQLLLRVALGLQLGGAMGNLIDRFRIGHVTDFLDFGPWPVFNIADLSIVTGAVILGWLVLQETRVEMRQKKTDRPAEIIDKQQAGPSDEWSTP